MVFASLLTTVLLALVVAADPIPVKRSLVTLPISRRINMMNGVHILEHNSSQAENQAVSYVASIGVGSLATQCKHCSS
jgi:cathepsin E